VREERVALKDVADPPLLGREVDRGGRVEEHTIVHHDAPRVRADQPREALEGQRLAGARRPEEPHDGLLGTPAHVEREPGIPFDDLDGDHR